MSSRIRIASRGSQLALWQAESIREALMAIHPGAEISIEIIRTTGDQVLDVPLARIGDRGLFTKQIDEALLAGNAELAVHSLKDLPTRIPDGLTIAAIGAREDPRDVVIARQGSAETLESLPRGSRVGTSSLRRRALLRNLRADLEVVDLRGNLNTRLAKLDAGAYDAIVLAAAGVIRLGWESRITESLSLDRWLPAVGQGALAIVCRSDAPELISGLAPLNDPETHTCAIAERSFLRSLEGGCQVPIGALAVLSGSELRLDGFVADPDGLPLLRGSKSARSADPEALGVALAEELRQRGAGQILAGLRSEPVTPVAAP